MTHLGYGIAGAALLVLTMETVNYSMSHILGVVRSKVFCLHCCNQTQDWVWFGLVQSVKESLEQLGHYKESNNLFDIMNYND